LELRLLLNQVEVQLGRPLICRQIKLLHLLMLQLVEIGYLPAIELEGIFGILVREQLRNVLPLNQVTLSLQRCTFTFILGVGQLITKSLMVLSYFRAV